MADIFAKQLSSVMQTMTGPGPRPLYQAVEGRDGEALIDGVRVVMTACNDYLGLSSDPRVSAAAARAVERHGTSCSGSRLIGGTLPLHEELERAVAVFLGQEAAIVTTTGCQANLALTPLFGRGDIVFSDMANHASLVDAVQAGRSESRRYRHSSMGHLERQLAAADSAAAKAVITDGLFSVEGDLCRLPELAGLARRHDARLVVDGAHDIGLLGAGGRGVAEHFGLMDEVDLYTGTFSKCFGSIGGFLAGPAKVIHFLRYTARSVIFTASMPPASAAAALAALEIISKEPERRTRVFEVARRVKSGLRALGFDTGHSLTPIVPVHIGETGLCGRMWQEVLGEGVFTSVVVAPAVAEGHALLRLSLQATHTDDHVTRILDAFATAGRRLGVIPASPPALPRQLAAATTAGAR
ncbi:MULTISPECIES: aminotransferase class I/II-fold pyridoxal phosphate-dependent enzyme [unclassified Streptomyces]|uniref:aminotransferase class I/II-fold pyridoxal phosphate-dependent enzyme n=1 Tax=unclassified Streptomyces TaxID=2593676 RepID=UPI00225585C8|nr:MULTISPECIES: aminotransferase class I/II-fold pyridoxal phosphate-dependent enzyme [unclassified Streptomyces]MCX4625365.1 aminotransferase class I/II-fold pyridoxal phosphate-dependent enzyme [Streptomyces sp. NBC_01443]WSW48968.1 aminotransferase class I/II-fold pyridoxal phosphate-dependent enzyme [Streptomyces sp. NBC_01001]